jgi:LytS/YehU family sensor histidine kinase
MAVIDPEHWKLSSWVRAVVPLRLSRGDSRLLLLGPRQGGRRYLSEDYEILSRLSAAVVEHVEQRRAMELQSLVSEAELRALQAQINPHFLFNSLNTLYGTIARDNAEARRLVLNLADVFRYFLRSDRPFIRVDEELKIVRAYLEIEELRLGSKLTTEIAIDRDVLEMEIPVLSIQPLVENAVKHGVAARTGDGFVRLSVRSSHGRLLVNVSNSGEFDSQSNSAGPGIGLGNVRRRLALCYGEASRIDVNVAHGVTNVSFALPLARSHEVSTAV